MKLCSIQPFSLAGPGGGPRILSSILRDAPIDVLAVCTAPQQAIEPSEVRELLLPSRPQFGRLESTRLNRYFGAADVALRGAFKRRLGELLRREYVTAVHAVAHKADFATAHCVARELDMPFYLSVHDDPFYTLAGRPEARFAFHRLSRAWREARERFVISPEMGNEMCRRFGDRSYVLVTDGLTEIAPAPQRLGPGPVVAYFMGAFHISYRSNLEAFVAGAAEWSRRSGRGFRLVMRSGPLPEPADLHPDIEVEFRDWASQAEVNGDLGEVDMLYLPLPFGDRHRNFVRYSLSTKLVSYAGSGLPILFLGPRGSAAGELLQGAGAAATVYSSDPNEVANGIETVAAYGEDLAASALDLARERFKLANVRERFWSAIEPATVV